MGKKMYRYYQKQANRSAIISVTLFIGIFVFAIELRAGSQKAGNEPGREWIMASENPASGNTNSLYNPFRPGTVNKINSDQINLKGNEELLYTTEQRISVNMNNAGLKSGDRVYISGILGGIYGSLNEPGTNPNNEMFDPDGDGIFSIDMHLADGFISFRFFIVLSTDPGHSWDNGDPYAGGDRTFTISGNVRLSYVWGSDSFTVSTTEKLQAGNILYPNPFHDELKINISADFPTVILTSVSGNVIGQYAVSNTGSLSINTSGLARGTYFVTLIDRNGRNVTQKLVKE
jgi:hypothetical protein